MSSQKKRESSQTKVALVCLKTHQNNGQITNQALLRTFSKYGQILKILIFERGPLLTKVFIEYEEAESVDMAIKSLNNTKLNSISCNVYHSRLQCLKLDNMPYTKGVDLTMPRLQEFAPQYGSRSEDPELKLLNEWEEFQFENNSTEDLSEGEEQRQEFSEEKLKDIRSKLSQIDDEISQTIETQIGFALRKLDQNTKCIEAIFDSQIICDTTHVVQIFQLFGPIAYLKQANSRAYVKYCSDQDCQRAYQLLKNFITVSIHFNIESIPGVIYSPEPPLQGKLQAIPISILMDEPMLREITSLHLQFTVQVSPEHFQTQTIPGSLQNQFQVNFQQPSDLLIAVARLRNLHKYILSSAQ